MLPSFLLALREGLEIALIVGIVFGALHQFKRKDLFATVNLGIVSAVLVRAALMGCALFRATIRLNIKRFFQITSILLLFFAAGLVAHGTHEFNEVGLIPGIVEPVWDTNSVLDENSVPGQILT